MKIAGSDQTSSQQTVLCVDLDGTIIRTDLLHEALLLLAKQSPWLLPLVPLWLLRGRNVLKDELAQRVRINPEHLPYRESVVTFIREEAAAGRKIVVASASHAVHVRAVADHLGIFDEVFGSTREINLKGSAKADALEARFGEKGFDYLGDSPADLKVWERAREALVAGYSPGFIDKVPARLSVSRAFVDPRPGFAVFLKAIRVHQWLKNLLVFVPLILAHRVLDLRILEAAAFAFIGFCCAASSVYLVNDLMDLEADRRHPRKRNRPCASGYLSVPSAIVSAFCLFLIAIASAVVLPTTFLPVLVLYMLITTAYSIRLKQVVLVDIFILAGLYTIRIIGGGVATGITVSQWLLGVSMFLFLSLACVKRYSELHQLRKRDELKAHGRGYHVDDMETVASFGAASGYMSALVLALYVSSREVENLYSHPQVIWLGCPLLCYWVSRVWLLARRGLVHEDPLVFALRDGVTYVVALLAIGIFVLAA